jgi:hypothetical protein
MTSDRDDLDRLDALLRAVRFEPRASLGAEVRGRWRRGEEVAPAGREGRRVAGLVVAALLLGLALGAGWWWTARSLHGLTIDRCCQDLDGGGAADDGLLVVSSGGTAVERLSIYEDRDGSRSYTPGDSLRFVRAGAPALAAPLDSGARTVEFCCLDYDGGGPSDDALLVVGQPPDIISLAAIYERRGDRRAPLLLR